MTTKRSSAGFSLAELLIVISIIAALIAGLLGIPWSNIATYARATAPDQIESAAGSARMIAMERGRRAAVIFAQTEQSSNATMQVVVESDTPGVFWAVDGIFQAYLSRGITVRAPTPAGGTTYYQTGSGGNASQPPDNGAYPNRTKCFAVAFDGQGRLILTGQLQFDATRHGLLPNGSNPQTGDLVNVPFAPYAAIVDTRTLVDANVIAFTSSQPVEDTFILNPPASSPVRPKIVAFNRYSGNALRP